MNLLLDDIGKILWVATVLKEAKTVLKFLTNHQRVLAIFRSKCSRQLLKPGETRFATEIMMLDRMFEQKQAIKETVHDADFET